MDVRPGEAGDGGGKADASERRAELKLTIAPTDIRRARYRLGLSNAASQQRRIWFFDTPALALYDAGTILRARAIDGDADDSTVKLRPFTADALAPELRALDGMKCELDQLLDHATPSCSLKTEQNSDEIAAVGRGERAIAKLFSAEQEAMYAAYGPAIGWDALVPLGPLDARVWTLSSRALLDDATAELWYMPDGSQTLELSMKVDVGDIELGLAQLLDFVEDSGLTLDGEQESKTRRALEALAR